MAHKAFKTALLALSLVHAGAQLAKAVAELRLAKGWLYADGVPIGGDFINMWTAGRMLLAGFRADIYRPTAFMAYEQALAGQEIGFRLWAYPPHSLLMLPPLGAMDYFLALGVWSLVGLGVLGWGARRLGFDWLETGIILLCPASLACVYYGQTGNLAAGLLLLALSARKSGDFTSIAAAALLTIKPQAGFLLPVLWAVQRRWVLIGLVTIAVLLLVIVSLAAFGPQPWRDYFGETLALLNRFERSGSGSFMLMMPSAFMSFRILTGNGDLAANLHLAFAAAVGGFVLWRMLSLREPIAQIALLLIGTVLITPYIHSYDLTLLMCGALLVIRVTRAALPAYTLTVLAWSLPTLVVLLNGFGVPLSPLLILPLLLLAGRGPQAVPLKRL